MKVFVALLLFCRLLSVAAYDLSNLETLTVAELAALLPEKPGWYGRPAADRNYWNGVAERFPDRTAFLEKADRMLAEKPDLSVEKWKAKEWPMIIHAYHLSRGILAECLEGDGKRLPLIIERLEYLLALPTWSPPDFDREGRILAGKGQLFDLHSGDLASILAVADWVLGEQLPPELRRKIRSEINRRIFEPYREALRQTPAPAHMWWVTGSNNWNPVCHRFLVDCAMTLVDSREERAKLMLPAIRNTVRYYLGAFPDDGYCGEGIHYWFYGLASYTRLAENLHFQTNGAVNLFTGLEKLDRINRFPLFLDQGGFYPAFSDSRLNTSPRHQTALLLLTLRAGMDEYWRAWYPQPLNSADFRALLLFDAATTGRRPPQPEPASSTSPAYWFRDSGVIVSRALPADSLSLALKAGNNGESHNHNDIGSFVIGRKGVPVITDPGAPAGSPFDLYSEKRYRNDFCNSFGHPVPVAGGLLQKEGKSFHGRILEAELPPERTAARLDLKPAYPAEAGLMKLERRFLHDRKTQTITICDEAEFDVPRDFGAALVTYGEAKELSPGVYRIAWRGAAVRAVITGESELEFQAATLNNRAYAGVKDPATRLGYRAAAPAKKHRLTVVITPE